MVGGASMSIVLELQQQAIESNSDVLSLLRKALLIARKLGLKDFETWINNELNGYPNAENIPEYRKVMCELKGFNPMRGWIPTNIPIEEIENMFSTTPLADSIPSLLALVENNDPYLTKTLNGQLTIALSSLFKFSTEYRLFISFNSIKNVVEQVKNGILDWALTLEENQVLGEGLSFTTEEKRIAQENPNITNYICNFYGNVTDLQFQQGTSKSSQHKK